MKQTSYRAFCKKRGKVSSSFTIRFLLVDPISSLNNSNLSDYANEINDIKLEIMQSACFTAKIKSKIFSRSGMKTELYDKREFLVYPS